MKRLFFLSALLLTLFCNAQDTTKHSWFGRTTGKLPSLFYGLGEDRLGGAKIGYLDSNVLIKVIDSTKELYFIQLSKYHNAYIEKGFVKPDSLFKPKQYYLTNSWMVKGTDSCYDIVNINIAEHLPYKSWMEINPSKIIVDIYGATSNTNWITQLQSLKEIKNVYYNQIEDDVMRVTIELKHQQHWGYTITYTNKSLLIKVKRQPDLTNLKKLKIAIDAGHGGTNVGAEGNQTHAQEKTYTLLFAKAFEKYLKKLGIKTIMTRTEDSTILNSDRVIFLQQQNPDLLISFHLNSSDNRSVSGSSTYYKHIGFRPLTQAILKRMLEIKMDEYGNVGSFNFALNAPTDFPNCLLEVAFLSNAKDEKKIVSATYRDLVVKQVYKGITDWIAQCKKQ
ncbi:N-acetylmuramoyl-L-alanine amidase [Chitinophagaceae bacterium LWZ2-11]